MEYKITATELTKRFNRHTLFRNLSFSLKTGIPVAITGPNGSGKSTLLQVIGGLQILTSGTITYSSNGILLKQNSLHREMSFVSPLSHPYEELTGYENILFAAGEDLNKEKIDSFLDLFRLSGHENKLLRTYSSGMKQRIKLICALIKEAPILFLDEPATNLDQSGREILYSHLQKISKNKLMVIATNEQEEQNLCKEVISLG